MSDETLADAIERHLRDVNAAQSHNRELAESVAAFLLAEWNPQWIVRS